MSRAYPLLALLAVSACAPPFAAPCGRDADCADGYSCVDARCVPGEGLPDDAGPEPDAGPPVPEVFVGPGEICDGVTIGCLEGRRCVYLGSRPDFSVCEPEPATEGGCATGLVAIRYCTADVDEAPPHTVDCTQLHCVEPPPGRTAGHGDACTSDGDCVMRSCAWSPDSSATVCRADRPLMLGARASTEDGTFTPACAAPMEGALEVDRGAISCRWPCAQRSDCPTGFDAPVNLCVQAEGLCANPRCNFEGCEGFPGSDCRFAEVCRADNHDMPGQVCGEDVGCVDDRPCWDNDETNICEPAPLLPTGGCPTGWSEATICDGPCRQACVFDEVCEDHFGLCETSRAGIGAAVSDPIECAFPLDAVDLGALMICAEGCVPTQGRTGFTCGEDVADGVKPESCDFSGDGFCPLPACDTCSGTEVCASTPSSRLFVNTVFADLEFCLDDGSCRRDVDCPGVCSTTMRTCATVDPACAGTALSGFQPANWLRDVDEGQSAQAVAVNGAVFRHGGSYLSDVATDYIYLLHRDGSGWSWILFTDFFDNPPDTESASVAADEINDRVVVYGGRDDNGDFVNELWTFDATDFSWTQHTPLVGTAPERADHTAAVVGDELVLIGGVDSGGPTNVVARYHFIDRTWTTETPAGSPVISDHAMVVRDDGTFLVTGAQTSVFTFDPTNSTWDEPTTGATLLNRRDAALVRDTRDLVNERYLLCGGDVGGAAEASCALIDEGLDVSPGPTLPEAILSPTAAVHPGTGRAIVEGDEGGFVLVPDDLCLP